MTAYIGCGSVDRNPIDFAQLIGGPLSAAGAVQALQGPNCLDAKADPADRWFDRLLAKLGLLNEAAQLFRAQGEVAAVAASSTAEVSGRVRELAAEVRRSARCTWPGSARMGPGGGGS